MANESITVEQIMQIQKLSKERWDIGVVKFSEKLLCTSYEAYKKWTGPRRAKVAGSVKPACALIVYALESGWDLEKLILVINNKV